MGQLGPVKGAGLADSVYLYLDPMGLLILEVITSFESLASWPPGCCCLETLNSFVLSTSHVFAAVADEILVAE